MMQKAAVGAGGALLLDHCQRCGGIWFEYGEVQLLRQQRREALWASIPHREGVARAQCHTCHAHIDRDAETCSACGTKTRFECPVCEQWMEQVRCNTVTLDVCRRCRGVWFDHHELSAIWERTLHRTLQRRRTSHANVADDGSLLLADALTFTPDLVFYGAHAAGQLAAAPAEAVTAAPGALVGAGEAVADASAGVFETLLDIVSGIFS